MKTTRTILALLMAALMCFAVFSGALAESIPTREVYSGTCGDNLAWELDTETGVLNITGIGEMYNYPNNGSAPWYGYRNSIRSVIIANGVTSIGKKAFGYAANYGYGSVSDLYYALYSITIPASVTQIGENAFYNYGNGHYTFLNYVYITDLDAWNSISFSGLGSNPVYYAQKFYLNGELITDLVIPDGITDINPIAFRRCSALNSVTFPESVTNIADSAFDSCTLNYSLFLGTPPTIGNYVFGNESSGFRIYYMSEHASEWSPNGEAAWNGYPIFPAYRVNFIDSMDGSVIDEQIVFSGNSAVEPEPPYHEGYAFTGWDVEFDNVHENLTVTAQYKVAYRVDFVGDTVELTDPEAGDTFYWKLSVAQGSGLASGKWLVDYDEENFNVKNYSVTWSGGIAAQINASWDDEEQWSDKPTFVCTPNYEGQTGSDPVGEAGNMYSFLGMYISSFDYNGVQMGGDMLRLTMELTTVPEESTVYPVPILVVDAKRLVTDDGGYSYGEYDFVNVAEGAVIVNISVPLPITPGDVDGDGKVNFMDIASLYLFLIGQGDIAPELVQNADFNGDGVPTYADITDMYIALIG